MDRSFSKFDEHMLGAGVLSTILAKDYERTVENFHELVKDATQESSDQDEYEQNSVPMMDSPSSKDAQASPKKLGRPRKRTQELLVQSTSHLERAPMMGQQAVFQADLAINDCLTSQNSTQQPGNTPNPAWDTLEAMPPSSDGVGMMQQQAGIDLEVETTPQYSSIRETNNYGIPTPQMMPPLQYSSSWMGKELPLPTSYSHYETSFVRRLIRASIEESYRLLMNPGSRPEDLQRLCTFAFCFIKAPRILQLFQDVMTRTARDNLEVWNVALYHIGDAGLHYPRVGIDASSEPPPWWADTGSMGPFPVPQPEIPVPEGIVDLLEYSGVDGEWFDSNDVVEYLGSKGLHLDINSSIVEITDTNESVSQGSYLNSQGTGSFGHSSGLSSTTTDSSYGNDAFLQKTPTFWSQSTSISPESLNMDIDTTFLETTLGDQSSDSAMLSGLIPPPFPFPTRMKKYFDVEYFLKGADPQNQSPFSILML